MKLYHSSVIIKDNTKALTIDAHPKLPYIAHPLQVGFFTILLHRIFVNPNCHRSLIR